METTNATPKKIMFNQNEACICGRIGSVEISAFTTKNGKSSMVAHLNVATNDRVIEKYENGKVIYAKDANGKFIYKENPTWHRVTAFKGSWVTPFENLTKGALVKVRGRLVTDKYPVTNTDGTPVLRDGNPLLVAKTYIRVDGESGSLGVVNLNANGTSAASAADGADGFAEEI